MYKYNKKFIFYSILILALAGLFNPDNKQTYSLDNYEICNFINANTINLIISNIIKQNNEKKFIYISTNFKIINNYFSKLTLKNKLLLVNSKNITKVVISNYLIPRSNSKKSLYARSPPQYLS